MASNYPNFSDANHQDLVSNAYQMVKNNSPLLPTSMPTYSGLANLKPRDALYTALTNPNQPSLAMSQFNQALDQNISKRNAGMGASPLAQRLAMLQGSQQLGSLMGQTGQNLSAEQVQQQQGLSGMLNNETQAGLARVQAINANKQAQQQMYLNLLSGGAQAGALMAL